MGKFGKVLAIIGAAVGVLSVLLSLVLPELFSWYHLTISGGPYSGAGIYLNAFGLNIAKDWLPIPAPQPPEEIAIMVLIGGILVLVGAALCIIGAFTEKKVLGILGGLSMIIGPLLLLADLLVVISDFSEWMDILAGVNDEDILFAIFEPSPGETVMWGLWIGFGMAIGGGAVGLIGGALV
ncbi:MAG: hypothetical protein ACFE9T_02860 [Promethearchaeota archaeon]